MTQFSLNLDDLAGKIPINEIPKEYFDIPSDLTPSTKMRIRYDSNKPLLGQVFGIVAPRGVCLLHSEQLGRKCISCDDIQANDPNLEFAHSGLALLNTGESYPIAPLSGDVGHAPEGLTAEQSRDWMGATGTQFARVRYHWHEYGLVAAGIIYPEVMANAKSFATIMASPTSLDARWMPLARNVRSTRGEIALRLTGAVAVVQAGIPIPGVTAAAETVIYIEGEEMAENDNKPCTCGSGVHASTLLSTEPFTLSDEDVKRLAEAMSPLVAAYVLDSLEIRAQADAIMASLSS